MKTRYFISIILLTILVLIANCSEIENDSPPPQIGIDLDLDDMEIIGLHITNTFEVDYICVVYDSIRDYKAHTSVIISDSSISVSYMFFGYSSRVEVRFQESIDYLESEVAWDTIFTVFPDGNYIISP